MFRHQGVGMRVGDNETDALASILVVRRAQRRLLAGSPRVVSAPALRNDERRSARPFRVLRTAEIFVRGAGGNLRGVPGSA